MKPLFFSFSLLIFSVISIGFTAFGQETSQRISPQRVAAREKLGKLGVAYNKESFVKQAAEGDTIAVKLFLAAGMNVNVHTGETGQTALLAAIDNRQAETALVILAARPNVDDINYRKETALMLAARTDQPSILKILLARHADLKLRSDQGRSALWSAAEYHSDACFLILVQNGSDVNERIAFDGTPIFVAVARDLSLAMVKLLVSKGVSVDKKSDDGFTALMAASFMKRPDTVRFLLSEGASVNDKTVQNHVTALMYAAASGTPEIIEMLIKNGADRDIEGVINTRKGPALWQAVSAHRTENVGKFIELHTDVNKKSLNLGITVLFEAISFGTPEIVDTLLKAGADPNIPSSNGLPPLNAAIGVGQLEVISMLIKAGANLGAKDKFDRTPLQLATTNKREDIRAILIGAGAKN